MKRISKVMVLAVLSLLIVSPLRAKTPETFPGKGESVEKSNAPSTGTQVKGTERATEVGKGKEKGLHKEPETKPETQKK